MNHSDYVIIRSVNDDTFGNIMAERGYHCFVFFRNQRNFIMKNFRRIWHKLNFPFKAIWYDKAVLKCDAKKIVIFDALCTVDYVKWLKKHKPDADIVFWYWNIITHAIDPRSIPEGLCRKWSFARIDCVTYNMRFNPLPYYYEIQFPTAQKEYDIVFVGRDKGRLPVLLQLEEQFESMGLTTNFVIAPTYSYNKNPAYSKPVSYMESVKLGTKARAILDYIEIDQSGQSLRVLEALFLHEKIITNSKLIFDYDFYCPENIFVLGHDDINMLPKFLSTPYKPIPEGIMMQYDFDAIVDRFFSGKRTQFDDMLERMRERMNAHTRED